MMNKHLGAPFGTFSARPMALEALSLLEKMTKITVENDLDLLYRPFAASTPFIVLGSLMVVNNADFFIAAWGGGGQT